LFVQFLAPQGLAEQVLPAQTQAPKALAIPVVEQSLALAFQVGAVPVLRKAQVPVRQLVQLLVLRASGAPSACGTNPLLRARPRPILSAGSALTQGYVPALRRDPTTLCFNCSQALAAFCVRSIAIP
jgi:hypothetical protein